MLRFDVDVSAFFAFQVDAPDEFEAAKAVRAFVRDVMTATPDTIEGYNSSSAARIVPAEVVPGVESSVYVERIEE